jgi:hypothetical protein
MSLKRHALRTNRIETRVSDIAMLATFSGSTEDESPRRRHVGDRTVQKWITDKFYWSIKRSPGLPNQWRTHVPGVLWCETAPGIAKYEPSRNGCVAIDVGTEKFSAWGTNEGFHNQNVSQTAEIIESSKC